MPYQGYHDGLYLLRQRSGSKGVDHYGVLDVGNRLGYLKPFLSGPLVIHQTPPQVRVDPLETTGRWEVLGWITDEAGALERIKAALQAPRYDLFGNNCEHFARYVAVGKRESPQLQGAVAFIGVVGLIIAAVSSGQKSA